MSVSWNKEIGGFYNEKPLKLKQAEKALNELKTRGYEDSRNIAIVLEYIMEKIGEIQH